MTTDNPASEIAVEERLREDAKAFELYATPPFLQVAAPRAEFIERMYETVDECRSLRAEIASLTAQLAKCREATVEEWPDCHKMDTPERVFFYEQDFYVLSNFSAFKVQWHHLVFDTSEAAYHWTRFATGFEFGDADAIEADKIADMILECRSAHDAFKLAQEHKCRQRPDWDLAKVGIMRRILRAKADQHDYVRRKLLATGDRELIEDSWRDDFWGWGPNREGMNMLGKLWMEIRSEYRALSTGERQGKCPDCGQKLPLLFPCFQQGCPQ